MLSAETGDRTMLAGCRYSEKSAANDTNCITCSVVLSCGRMSMNVGQRRVGLTVTVGCRIFAMCHEVQTVPNGGFRCG